LAGAPPHCLGTPIRIKAWQQVQNETGVPVLVDAAAALDTLRFLAVIEPPFVLILAALT
jgi:hypothetical protein